MGRLIRRRRSSPMPVSSPRRVSCVLTAVGVAMLLPQPSSVAAHVHRHVHWRSAAANVTGGEPKNTAIVMDARSGEVLYSERADSLRYPASVTKVMTMYMAFEALAAGKLHLTDSVV